MSQALKTGRIAIYARYSSENQNESSINDQVRRCREHIARNGGDPDAAKVYADYAISGASLECDGFETMMAAVQSGAIKSIVTEGLSRISRDFADSAILAEK